MNKPLILIVEDDAPIRNLISVTLEAHEYRHITAANANAAANNILMVAFIFLPFVFPNIVDCVLYHNSASSTGRRHP